MQMGLFDSMGPASAAGVPAPAATPAFCFYLGTHQANWLEVTDVPLFISRRRLAVRRRLPRAKGRWCLDSSGFTELAMHGRWTVPAKVYAAEVRRFQDEIGGLQWAAIQDWMVEPNIRAKTGLSVEEHQRRTVQSWLDLKTLAPDLPWAPVLQGWSIGDYFHHLEMYDRADPSWCEGTVGVGSLCRRQATMSASAVIAVLKNEQLRVHAFGFKKHGLKNAHKDLESADSMAWSFCARNEKPLPGCAHKNCANCLKYALKWRAETLANLT